MDSSPRFRSTNSDNNSTYPCNNNNGPTKLRLMCSNGGHIVPRPHDKSLCYVGGETRMVAVDRHTTLLDLTRRLSKTLFRSSSSSTATSPPPPPPPSSFTLKYQLPSEDLDSLISVTTDEDLENMIDEYERLNERLNERSNSSSRLRLFVFPTNPESVSSIGSFLENPVKSEDWFLNALNGTNSGFSDTSSVNCLLDLDDEIGDKKDVSHKRGSIGTTTNLITGNNNSGQDIHSIPDSPWMETTTTTATTTSSFGSASSTPSIANLPPIRVNGGDEYSKNIAGGGGGMEEQVSQIAGGLMASPAPVVVSGSTAMQEQSDPFLSYQERSEQGLQMSYVKHLHHQQQQNQSTGFDLASMDSILSDLSITEQSSPVSQTQSSSYNNRTHDQITGTHNSAYLSPMPTAQVDSPRHQLHYQQPQFIPPLQYIHHHHHPSPPVPAVTPYYHHHHPPMDQQNFMYYIPATQPPQGYNFPFQQPQPSHADHTTPAAATPINQAAMKTEFPVYRTTSSGAGAPQLVRVHSGYQNQQQPQHVGYSEIHQQAQAQPVYYATQAMPRLAAPQYQNMMLVSPVETNLHEQQVRTAQPRQDR